MCLQVDHKDNGPINQLIYMIQSGIHLCFYNTLVNCRRRLTLQSRDGLSEGRSCVSPILWAFLFNRLFIDTDCSNNHYFVLQPAWLRDTGSHHLKGNASQMFGKCKLIHKLRKSKWVRRRNLIILLLLRLSFDRPFLHILLHLRQPLGILN